MTSTWRRGVILTAAVLLVLGAGVVDRARADGGGGDDSPQTRSAPNDPDYTTGVRAIKERRFTEAILLLRRVVDRDVRNADAFNWLAYATRSSGDAAGSLPIYEKALAIDPKHRGAHEYVGEAYLTLGNVAKAREHLARLAKLCFLPCSEYRDLKNAVEEYEKTGKSSAR